MWRSLVQPHLDYGSQLWAPVDQVGQIRQLENPLRSFTRRVDGIRDKPYSERLRALRLYSVERRMERYRVLYIFKMLMGKVPDLGLRSKNTGRAGFQVIQPTHSSKATGKTWTLINRSIMNQGPLLFKLLPNEMREFRGSVDGFKYLLDKFLQTVPDIPRTEAEEPLAMSLECVPSNRLEDWMRAIARGRVEPRIGSNDCEEWCL